MSVLVVTSLIDQGQASTAGKATSNGAHRLHRRTTDKLTEGTKLFDCGLENCRFQQSVRSVDQLRQCLQLRCSEDSRDQVDIPQQDVERELTNVADKVSAEQQQSRDVSAGQSSTGQGRYCEVACELFSMATDDNETFDRCLELHCTPQSAPWKRWGNRLQRGKRWGNRVGRSQWQDMNGVEHEADDDVDDGEIMWVKRWANRLCVDAHCRSLQRNRMAFVACGQSYCGGRR
jgi:hypothetical protein